MPISFRSSRKPLVERSRSRISVSLCWTRGWPTRCTAFADVVFVDVMNSPGDGTRGHEEWLAYLRHESLTAQEAQCHAAPSEAWIASSQRRRGAAARSRC